MSTSPEAGSLALASEGVGQVNTTEEAPVTTTVSTIAVQSGNTRIVIALLQSKEWMQLKIQEIYPSMTEVGSTLEEAMELQQQHEQVLEKLQTKQSPVEELLNQADELISNQKPKAEVYAAMADNLGLAWKDLNAQLEQRRQILEQAVNFYSRASEFVERMDVTQKETFDSYLPSDTETCKLLLQQHHDAKKGMLEASMHTLNEGQSLLECLREVGIHSMGDSRPEHMRHAAQQACIRIECYMESLHDKRRSLEAQWLKRKTQLEQCLQLCLLYSDMDQVENWVKTKGKEYLKQNNLGDSAAGAEILLHEHQKALTEAKEAQDRAVRLLKTAEQLANSGHYASEEIKTRGYTLLSDTSEILASLDQRKEHLSMSLSFFNMAQTALNKLDQIEVQLTTIDLPRSSAALVQQHAQLAHAIEDITSPALHEGHILLQRVGRNDSGATGVARKIAELEDRRHHLSSLCTAHRAENLERSAAFTNFCEKYEILYNWILSAGLAFLQGHQDMGSVLSMAKHFLQEHERLQNEAQMKGIEVQALLSIIPPLLSAGDEEAEAVQQKAKNLRYQWSEMKSLLENRIKLSQHYVSFHKLAVQLANEMDVVEEMIREKEPQNESIMKQMEEKWMACQQIFLQLNNTGKNFIENATQVDDKHLDTKRAILCVETILEDFKTRKEKLSNLWMSWQTQVSAGKEQKIHWEQFLKDAQKTIESAKDMQEKLYPIIPRELNNAETIAEYLEKYQTISVPTAKRVLMEVEMRLKTAETIQVSPSFQNQKDSLVNQFTKLHQELNNKIAEFHVLLTMMVTLFHNFVELEKLVEKQEVQYVTAVLPSGLDEMERMMREHDASKPTILELFKFTANEAQQVINKISQVEPLHVAPKDTEKIKMVDGRKKHFETAWEEHKRKLEQQYQFCLFNRDLQQINYQLSELSKHLEDMRGNYGESLPGANATSQAFVQFEKTIELLEKRIQTFISTAEKMLIDQHAESSHIKTEIHSLQNKWSTFHMNIGENRRLIDLSIEYFSLIEEADEWFKEGSTILVSIARKSTSCKSPNDANNLLDEVRNFLKPGEVKQDERLRKISTLATQLYGLDHTPMSMQQVSGKNKEMLESFSVINDELSSLAESLKEAEQERERQKKEKEEADAAVKAAQAEAAAAKAAAAAAQEAVKAAQAAAKAVPVKPVPLAKVTIDQQEAVPIPIETQNAHIEITKPLQFDVPKPKAPVFVVPLIDAEVMEGSKYTFICQVDGFPQPEVQWFKDSILIQNNPDYQTTYVDGMCTLTIEETFTEDSARFSCKAVNPAGTAETQGLLTVNESRPHEELIPPHFTQELQDGVVQEGKSFQFECVVVGNPLPLVSWFKNDICIDNSPDYAITNNNGQCTLKIEEAYLEDESRYTCRAANQAGQVACSAKLTVKPLEAVELPKFLTPLSNVMARAGQKLRLECRVQGQPEPVLSWFHNGKPITNREMHYDGNKATLFIIEAFPKDAGTYMAVAKNQAGEATSSCNVLVKGRLPMETSDSELASDMEPVKPKVMQPLKNLTVGEGSTVRMDCIIVGQPEPEVIWYHNEKPVKESNDIQLLFEGDKCSLIIHEAYLEDAGTYKCVAINSGGEASSTGVLTVESLSEVSDIERSHKDIILSIEKATAPKFSKLLMDTSVIEGQRVKLECQVTGEPQPFVSWYKDGKQIDASNDYQITHDNSGLISLTIPEVFPEDGGSYTVKATNKAGEAKCFCTLSVSPKKAEPKVQYKPSVLQFPPKFTQHLMDTHVGKGKEAKFECNVTGTPKPKIQWCYKGWPITADKDHKITADGDKHCLVIPTISSFHSGRYSITAENPIGKATSSALLVVEEPFDDKVLWDGFGEPKIQSMVMMKKTTMMQTSTLSKSGGPQENGGYSISQSSAVEEHGYRRVGEALPEEYHSSEKSVVHEVDRITPTKTVVTTAVLNMDTPAVTTGPAAVWGKTSTSTPKYIAPRFLKPVSSTLVEVGEKVYLEGQIEGNPEPTVKWFKNNLELRSKPEVLISLTKGKASLLIPKATESDSGRYSCSATNEAGQATSTAEVVVKPHRVPPKFIKRLQACVVKAGEKIELDIEVAGDPLPEVTWYRNNELVKNSPDFRLKSEGSKHSLVIPEAFPDDACILTVKATNCVGEAQSTANLIVEEDLCEVDQKVTYKEFSVVEQKKELVTKVSVAQSAGPEPLQLPSVTAPPSLPVSVLSAPPHTAGIHTKTVPPTSSPKPVASNEKFWPEGMLEKGASQETVKVVHALPQKLAMVEKPRHVDECKKPFYMKPLPTTPEKVFTSQPKFVPVKTEEDEQEKLPIQKPLHRVREPKPLPKETIFGPKVESKVSGPPTPAKPQPVEKVADSLVPSPEVEAVGAPKAQEFEEQKHKPAVIVPVVEEPKIPQPSLPLTQKFPAHLKPQPEVIPSKVVKTEHPLKSQAHVIPQAEFPPPITPQTSKYIGPPPPKPSKFFPKVGTTEEKEDQPLRLIPIWSPGKQPEKTPTWKSVQPPTCNQRRHSAPIHSEPPAPSTFSSSPHLPTQLSKTEHTPNIPATIPRQKPKSASICVAVSQTEPVLKPGPSPKFGFVAPQESQKSSLPLQKGISHSLPKPIIKKEPPPEHIALSDTEAEPSVSPIPPKPKKEICFEEAPVTATEVKPPVFIQPLVDVTVKEKGRAVLQCETTGTPNPVIKWFRNNVQITSSSDYHLTYKDGFCTLVIPEVYPEDSGKFTCTATNIAGTKTTSAHLNVEIDVTNQGMVIQPHPTLISKRRPPNATPPIFEKPPIGGRFIEGGDASFECRVRGNPPPEVTWSRRGMPIKNDQRRQVSYNPDTGVCSLHIRGLTAEDDGDYTCTAVNCAGEASLTVSIQREVQGQVYRQTQEMFKTHQFTQQTTFQRAYQTFGQERVQQPSDQQVIQPEQEVEPGSPFYYGVPEGFRVDTFEYRLLREIEFRESSIKRQQGELEPPPSVVLDKSRPPSAPEIFQHPRNSKLLEGADATFQAKISGNPRPTITWFKNGQKIVQSQRYTIHIQDNTVTLHIHMVLPEDAGYYTLLAENPSGRVACSCHLVIEAMGTVSETRYTSSQRLESFDGQQKGEPRPMRPIRTSMVENDVEITAPRTLKPNFIKIPTQKEVTEGKMVRFDCRVSGRPFPEVLWFHNGKQIMDDATHKLLVNEGGMHALMITVTNRNDSGTYTCIARNKSGESRFEVNLTVIEKEQVVPPKFVERFQSTHVKEGEPVTLHCRAVGIPVPRITWQKDGVQIYSNPPEMVIETQEGSSSLYFSNVTVNESAWYQCTAQNQAGSTATRARLYVSSEPQITGEPWKLSLPRPTKVIRPEGSPPRETIWLRHVERSHPHVSHEEESRPPQKPAFTTHLRDLHLQEGDRASFDARLIPIGDPSMEIEWFVNGQFLEASSRVMTIERFGYVALTLLHVNVEDAGVYQCRASNEAGEAITTATLHVSPRAMIESKVQHPESWEAIQQLEDWERYKRYESVEESLCANKPVFIKPLNNLENLQEGGFAHFEAQITPVNDPTMSVEWYFNGQPLTAGTRVSTTFSFGYVALNIKYLRAEDSGIYMCKAINQKGEALSTATLKVTTMGQVVGDLGFPEQQRYQEKIQELESWQQQQRQQIVVEEAVPQTAPVFRSPLRDIIDIQEGKIARFEARVEPTGDSNMRVEWLKDGKPLEASSRTTMFFNFGYVSLTIRGVDTRDAGSYTCMAINNIGTAKSSATLTCKTKQSVVLETHYPEGLEKIQHFEDSSHYQRATYEETIVTQRPQFIEPLVGKEILVEGQSAHFETRLEPVGDPNMIVEWYFNGYPLTTGHRFKTYFDFGYVALDILYVFPEDSGNFTVKAKNALGEITQSKTIRVQSKTAVDTTTMHEVGLEQIGYLERPHYQEPQHMIEEKSKSKPIFTHPLHNPKPLREGERVHLECRLEPANDPTMKVEWFFNGKPLKSGSRFQTRYDFGFVALDILTAYPEDAGEYTVRATNQLGSSHTSAIVKIYGKSAIILESQHPEGLEKIQQLEHASRYHRAIQEETIITQMPTFTKPLHNIEVIEGTNIHLECRLVPVGDPTMKVEWLINNVPIRIGHRFRPATEFDYVALDILSIYPEDSGVYTCRATSSLGQAVTSCSVKCIAKSQIIFESQQPESLEKIQYLEDTSRYKRETMVEEAIKVIPKFTSRMHDLSLREGQEAHLECRLEPVNDPSLKVEWFRNGVSLPTGHRYRPFHDFGYVALNILSLVPEDSGTYTCRATNSMGTTDISSTIRCQSKTSIISETQHPEGLQKIQKLESYAKFTRQEEEEATTQAPVFTSPPRSVEIEEGQRVHFECRLIPVGDPKLKVEWFQNGKPVKMGSRFIETHSFGFVALDIMYAYPEDAGTYTCKATNALGEAVTSAQLRCYEKGKLVLESQQPDSLQKIQKLEDSGHYQRTVSVEEVTTQAPVFTQPMRNLQLLDNQSAHFECRLIPVGDPKLRVEWLFNGMPLMHASRVTTMHDFGFAALDLSYVKPEDSGTYTCKATNDLGQAVCSATLTVKRSSSLLLEPQQPDSLQKIQYLEDSTRRQRAVTEEIMVSSKPVFVTPLRGPTKLAEGQSSHLECRIEPYPDPTMKIEWFYNGQILKTGHRFRTMYDFGFAALDILSVNAEDSGEYMIKATNSLGISTSTAVIQVTGKSGLILEPQQPDSLQKIQYLEDASRFQRATVQEVVHDERPAFGRPLYNLENLNEGQKAHLEATLTPVTDPNLKVEWYFNGRPIQQGHRFKTTCDFGYVALDILYVLPEDSGTYMCKARNNVGEAVTTCSLRVKGKSGIIMDTLHEEGWEKIRELETSYIKKAEEPVTQISRPVFLTPLTSQENIKEGQPIHMECRLEPINDPKLQVMWYINGMEIKAGHRLRTTHDFGYVALDILYAYPEDTGTYMCKAVNELGEAVVTCFIKIQGRRSVYYDTQHPEGLEKIKELECQPKYQPVEVEEQPISCPYFTLELKGTTELVEGQNGHLECRVEPAHDSNLQVEVLHNGRPLDAGSRFHVTFDFGYVALDIKHVLPEDTGIFTVKAKNNFGEATSSININVQGKTSIIMETQHPEGLVKIQELEDESRQRRDVYVEPRTFQRPVFTAPLQNLDNLVEGQEAHLECRLIPVGDPTLKVEWFCNEKPLQPSSRAKTAHDFGYVALYIQYVRPDDTGVYMCRASNELGEAVTTASVKVKSKTSILLETQHPEGLEKIQELETAKIRTGPEEPERVFEKPVFTMPLTGPQELVEGQPAHFECRVVPVGDPNLKFEWYVNGVELKTGTRIQETHDFGLVSLNVMSTIPEDSGVYMCKAINLAGEAVTTSSIKVKSRQRVLEESQHPEAHRKTQKFELDSSRIPEVWWDAGPATRPVFTKHLINQEKLIEGQNVHLEARVEPANDEKLKVEWYKNSKAIISGTRIKTTFDFGFVSLDIIGIRPDDSGIYTCRAVNEAGETISTCTIKVEGREGVLLGSQHPESLQKIQQLETSVMLEPEFVEPLFEVPVFTTHLNNLEHREGESAHFHCRVEPAKDPTLTVDFLVNGKPLPAAAKFMAKKDFGFITLDISCVYTRDAGIYTCRATNSKGQAVTTGSLKVHGKEDIIYGTQHPMGEVGLSRVQQVEEAYLSRYQVPMEEVEQVFPKPVFVEPLQANFNVNEGEGLRLQCRYEPSADPKLVIEWFFNGKSLELASRFTSTSDFGQVALAISDLWPRDSGVYTCRAHNNAGEAFTSTTIQCIGKSFIYEGTLHPEGERGLEKIQDLEESLARLPERALSVEEGHSPVFTSQFQNLTNLSEGDIAHFEATLTPASDQTMVVEWFFNEEPLKAGHRIRTVHTFGMVVLEILGVIAEDTGRYTCRAANKWGKAEITVVLETVDRSRGQKPHFTTPLRNIMGLKEGDSAHFECTLVPVGDSAMKIEWFQNGQPLRESSRIKTVSDFGYVVMDISFVHVEDAGEYICVATNKYGSDTTRCFLECAGHGKIFRDSLQPQSLEKIAALEGYSHYQTTVLKEPLINEPPKFHSQIQPLVNLVEGQSAHFEAQLTPLNDPNLRVEWFFNGQPLRHGHRFRTFHDFGIVILDILYCYGEDSGEYMCRATNRIGTDVTKTVLKCRSKSSLILEPQLPPEMSGGTERIIELEEALHRSRMEVSEEVVGEAPRFTKPLDNLTNIREGENAHFEARLTPTDDPDLTLDWFKDGKPLRAGTRIRTIHDFGFVVLEISPVYPEDSGVYSCRAINRLGEAVTTCTMTCEGKRGIILETQLPESMETSMEKIARFEDISSSRVTETWMDIDVAQAPKFTTKPQDISLPENSLAHFECRLMPVGDPTMRVEWFHNGKPLITGTRIRTISDFGFVILEIAGVYQRDIGVYTCKAMNRVGEATVSASLNVKSKASIILEPQLPEDFRSGTETLQRLEESLYQTREAFIPEEKLQPPRFITHIRDVPNKVEGDSAHFECRLEPQGDPTLTVEWYHNGKPLITGSRVHTINDFGFVVLEIDWLFPRDAGEYVCQAINKCGTDSTKAVLKVKSKRDIIIESQLPEGMSADKLRELEYPSMLEEPVEEITLQPPHFITHIQPQENLNEGDSAHFECRLEPINDPKLRVEWYHNGQPLRSGHKFKTTHDFGFVALDVLYVYPEDCGEYMARAFNDLGEDVTKSTLKCKGKPSLIYRTQLPKKMEGGVQKIAEMEAAWQRVDDIEEMPQEKTAPMFVMKPEPQVVLEGDWAKFQCRVTGNPRPRLMWILNGQTVVNGSRYRLTYDGIFHLDIPKSRQYDQGKVEVIARNALGQAYCWTTLEVKPRFDDYRAVLKHSPKPWYDSEVKRYQKDRKETELHKVFEEKLTPGGTKVDVWKTHETEGERVKVKQRLEEDTKKVQPEVKKYKTDAFPIDSTTSEKKIEEQPQVPWITRTYKDKVDHAVQPPTFPETIVHGKEVHVSKQKQIQKEVKGQWEVTRHKTLTETMEQEHKGVTQERKVIGLVPETKPPVFTKKIQPCRALEGESAQFECIFTGTPIPTITWYRENFPITSSQDFMVSTTDNTSTLTIREVYLEDSGIFSVKAENRGGTAKSSSNLVVEERKEEIRGLVPPSFTKTLQETSAKSGQLVRLDARVSGSKPLDIYWLKNGKKVLPDITHKMLEEDDLCTLLILEAAPEDTGTYECVALNKVGEGRCQAQVNVEATVPKDKPISPKEAPKEVKAPELLEPLKPVTVNEGQPAVFKCRISGSPAPRGKWFRGDTLIKQSRYFCMSVEKEVYSLRISEAFPEDKGIYKCVAANSTGTVSTSANLNVIAPEVTEVPPSLSPLADLTIPEGSPARFVTSVTGVPTPQIVWYKEGTMIKPSRDFQMAQDTGSCSLVIRQTYPEDEGIYTCKATNTSGQTETSARLTVESKH